MLTYKHKQTQMIVCAWTYFHEVCSYADMDTHITQHVSHVLASNITLEVFTRWLGKQCELRPRDRLHKLTLTSTLHITTYEVFLNQNTIYRQIYTYTETHIYVHLCTHRAGIHAWQMLPRRGITATHCTYVMML